VSLGVIVVDEGKLSSVLSEFARTLITDFPIQQILDHLVERIVGVLPITSAGVTLIGPQREPRFVAASDASALRYERLQTEIGEGPCVVSFDSGAPVVVVDVASEERFPAFTTAALAAGLGAVFTFPLHHGEHRLGALDLYREAPGGLDEHTMATAQTLADVAAAYLINAQARDDARVASEQHRQRAMRTGESTAILFVDLDDFKLVNDTHGHHVGDELLVAVAHRLAALVRPDDTLARVSGDEFVLLCENLVDRSDAEVLVRRIEESFELPFELSGVEVTLTASVGIAVAGPGEVNSDRLLVEADSAMSRARQASRWGRHLPARREVSDLDGCIPTREVRSALYNDELEVVYQPLVRRADGLITGVKALLRWTHPTRGAVSPAAIVAVAEQSDLISEVGAWVLERGGDDRTRWLASHPGVTLDLAVNVSVRQLLAPDFLGTVATVLAATDTAPTGLILEVTESVLMEDLAHSRAVLDQLRATGVRIALDDLETEQQHDEITAIGCESAQEPYDADPMTAAAIDQLLSEPGGGAGHLPRSEPAPAVPAGSVAVAVPLPETGGR